MKRAILLPQTMQSCNKISIYKLTIEYWFNSSEFFYKHKIIKIWKSRYTLLGCLFRYSIFDHMCLWTGPLPPHPQFDSPLDRNSFKITYTTCPISNIWKKKTISVKLSPYLHLKIERYATPLSNCDGRQILSVAMVRYHPINLVYKYWCAKRLLGFYPKECTLRHWKMLTSF